MMFRVKQAFYRVWHLGLLSKLKSVSSVINLSSNPITLAVTYSLSPFQLAETGDPQADILGSIQYSVEQVDIPTNPETIPSILQTIWLFS